MLWTYLVRDKRRFLLEAYFRAYRELRNALDAAGQVYVLGKGPNNQVFQNLLEEYKTPNFKFQYYERLLELWNDRIFPQQLINRLKAQRSLTEAEAKSDLDKQHAITSGTDLQLESLRLRKKTVIDPYREALSSLFKGLVAAKNTVALWGRRIHHVAMSESVVLALSDTGDVYVFGGKGHWWDQIQPESNPTCNITSYHVLL